MYRHLDIFFRAAFFGRIEGSLGSLLKVSPIIQSPFVPKGSRTWCDQVALTDSVSARGRSSRVSHVRKAVKVKVVAGRAAEIRRVSTRTNVSPCLLDCLARRKRVTSLFPRNEWRGTRRLTEDELMYVQRTCRRNLRVVDRGKGGSRGGGKMIKRRQREKW